MEVNMKNSVYVIILVILGVLIGKFDKLNTEIVPAYAQEFNDIGQGNDALWHLPSFAEKGWFLHASNGRVRACNLDKVSVVGNKAGPRCTEWQ
jgi:hypothetical protein